MKDFMLKLRELQVILSDGKINLLEAHEYFINNSDKGENCTYAIQAQERFRTELLPKVQELLLELVNSQ